MAGAPEHVAEHERLRRVVRATLSRISQTGELPTLPNVATAALGIVRAPEADVDELCGVIRMDVGLTARVLRVANSPGSGRRRPTRSIQDAIVTLGLRQTCDLLVAVCAKQLYAPGPYTELLWNHSLAAAVAAEEIARITGLVKPGMAFLPGLFHDVGKIAFQVADVASFTTLQELVDAGEGSSLTFEREWYAFDHAQAGCILTEDWGLMPEQCAGIRWHHDPSQAPAARDLASIINAADAMAYAIGCGTTAEAPGDISIRGLGLSPADEAALAERVRQAFETQKKLVG